ncbi:MAG: hypothetical protein JSU05_10015 [Bacteroidetes bacterium]|nr:hypothetical protein [Bacteroidota bacterium]
MKKLLIVCIVLFITATVTAQNCEYTPADCPDAGSIEAALSASVRSGNGLSDKEIEMQDRMRNLVTDMMQHAAKTLGWRMIELDEVVNLNPFQSGSTPQSLKSPRYYGIEFEFIVNKDSLKAWKDWLIDFSNRYTNATSNYMNNQSDIANSPLYKQYSDSVDKYLKLYTDYMTAHQSEGAALFQDKKAKNFQDKEDEYNNKRVALLNQTNSKNYASSYDDERKQRTMQFRESSTVEIFFEFNPGVSIINSSDGNEQVSNYNLPGVAIAKSVHLSEPDPNSIPWHFDQWKNMNVLLFGKWLPKPDQNKNYNAEFTLNGQSDERTPKKIGSDKVQTIAIHIMGSYVNMDKLIKQLDITKLNEAVFKK